MSDLFAITKRIAQEEFPDAKCYGCKQPLRGCVCTDPRQTYSSLPTWLRGLRERLSLSQAELGIKIGVARVSVNRWENGITYPPPRYRQALNELAREHEYPAIVPRWRA